MATALAAPNPTMKVKTALVESIRRVAIYRQAPIQPLREVLTGYDRVALDNFETRARRWAEGGRDAYIFMINGAKVRAPAAALALQDLLR